MSSSELYTKVTILFFFCYVSIICGVRTFTGLSLFRTPSVKFVHTFFLSTWSTVDVKLDYPDRQKANCYSETESRLAVLVI